jgi:hypothetical protein
MARTVAAAFFSLFAASGLVLYAAEADVKPEARLDMIRRAHVWTPTTIPSMDIAAGPAIENGFAGGETVTCTYIEKKMSGRSPKFTCVLGDKSDEATRDEIKVKYGRENGEVYAEVAATRLLWALGFGADIMYPEKVICHDCPPRLGGTPNGKLEEMLFDPAAVERKLRGEEITTNSQAGWKWSELDLVNESAGGAPAAHRDALKLLAAFLQHSDSKAEQQRLLCLDGKADASGCTRPLMMINDLGLTFGRASATNSNAASSVNFERWSRTRVWKDKTGCVANLSGSITGTLKDPRISEEGRAFLADLLTQLTDQQILDLFKTARFHLRARAPHTKDTVSATAEEWRDVFKQKRDEIVTRRCETPAATTTAR